MLKATAATEQSPTMTGTKSGPPTTFSESSRKAPLQLCIKYEEIAGVAEAFSKTIAARADWSNPPKTKDELRLQTKPYTDLYNAAYALHRTMDTVPWDRGTIQAGEERWYHNQLHEASRLENTTIQQMHQKRCWRGWRIWKRSPVRHKAFCSNH